jgi:glycosyltransferase involved in cell wall biosynthesis
MTEPIRILHVIGIMDRGGAETMIMNLYRNIDRTKIQFDFVQNEGGPAAYDEEIRSLGGRIFHCPRYKGKNHFTYTRWWRDFFADHPGEYPIVHGHIGSTAAIYLSIAKKYGAYAIAHSHNTNKMKTAGDVLYAVLAYPARYIADHFFACGKEAGISRYGRNIGGNAGLCTVLCNAIDTELFMYSEQLRNSARNVLGVNAGQIVVGNISRFSAQKNHTFLLHVFEQIHRINPDTVLLLVGDGDLRPQIEAQIAASGLQDAVILTGVRSDTWNYYQAMDVFLMPSLYEGLPVSLVEAQTAGLPCCVSDGVPQEAAITKLVQFKGLDASAEEWAAWVLNRASEPRQDYSAEMAQAGYSIVQTARWLQDFYEKVVTDRGQ